MHCGWHRCVGWCHVSEHSERSQLVDFRTSIPVGKQLNSVICEASETCIAVGTNLSSVPYVIGTSNNGATWSAQDPPSNAVDLTGISCSSAYDCIAVGNSGNTGAGSTIMGTTTGGLSWTSQAPPRGVSGLNAISCPSTADCFAAGVSSVLTSVNAGYAWSAQTVPPEVSGLNGISCPTTSDCTAVGFGIFGSPVAIGTTDAGLTWTPETLPSGVGILTAVSCVSASTCHAVSDFGSTVAQHHRDDQWREHVDTRDVPRYGHRFHRDLLRRHVELHRSRFVLRRSRCGDPQHHGWWRHLATSNRSPFGGEPRRRLVFERHVVCRRRVRRDQHLRRRQDLGRPGHPCRIDAGLPQLH